MRSSAPFRMGVVFGLGLLGFSLFASQRSAASPPTPHAAQPAAAPAAARPDAIVAPVATPPVLTDAQRKSSRGHIQAGRKHADAREWAPAVAEFEAALQLTPEDATALSELTFAALQAGDVAKAKRAGTAALSRAATPPLKAAALYNLGRIAEREGDDPGARAYYEQAEALRPSEELHKRRVGLDDPARKQQPALPCTRPQPLGQLCACLRKTPGELFFGEVNDSQALECEIDARAKLPAARLVSLANGASERSYLIVAGAGQAWSVLGELFHATVNDHHEERLEKVTFTERELGTRHLLWAEYRTRGTEGNGSEVRNDETVRVALCMLTGASGASRCAVNAPLAHTGTRTVFLDGKPKSYPFSSKYRVDLAPDGTASVIQIENRRDDKFDEVELGPRRLW